MRIIGPNSFGIIRPNSNLYATFAEKKAVPGKIAFHITERSILWISIGLVVGNSSWS